MIAQRPERDVPAELLSNEPTIESLISQLASLGGLLQPSSSTQLDQWPAEVIQQAGARAHAIRSWLADHETLGPSDPAFRMAATMLLTEIALVTSFLRSTSNGAVTQLDGVRIALAAVREALESRLGSESAATGEI